jgi:putative redox protein
MAEVVETQWMGNMAFESRIDSYTFRMDSDESHGGTSQGPRPKPLVLSALAGCTGMDIVSILQKKKVVFDSFTISVSGELTETFPKYYKQIHIVFTMTGPGFENNADVLAKVERAVQLSHENYCAVSAMLKGSCEISHEIRLQNS